MSKWRIEYDNDTGANDDYFHEHWDVTDGVTTFGCESEEDAEWLVVVLDQFGADNG